MRAVSLQVGTVLFASTPASFPCEAGSPCRGPGGCNIGGFRPKALREEEEEAVVEERKSQEDENHRRRIVFDSLITRQVPRKASPRSSGGADDITNVVLQALPEVTVGLLTQALQRCYDDWCDGTPASWGGGDACPQ